MKKRLIFLLCSMIALTINVSLALAQPVLITGDLVDNSSYPWSPNFVLTGSNPIYVNIDPNMDPVVGRFMISANPGDNTHFSLVTTGKLPFNIDICDFTLSVDNESHASIQLTGTNDQTSVVCRYSGDPNTNTAQILITNK